MTKINIYSKDGKMTSGSLPKEFSGEPSLFLLAQAIRVYEDRSHKGIAKTKTRGELTRSTRKIYAQKGTGNARHGSRMAPIFVGGGVTHGPRGTKRVLTLPRAMRQKALKSAVLFKAEKGKIAGLSGISKVTKTKEAGKIIETLKSKFKDFKNPHFTVVFGKENIKNTRFFKNLADVSCVRHEDLNAYTVMRGGVVLFDSSIFEVKKGKKEIKS